MEPGFRIIEHTADVGIESTAASLEELIQQTTYGLADIIGIRTSEAGEVIAVELEGADPGGLLVDWLSEVIYLHDSRDALIENVAITEANEHRLRGIVRLAPRGDRKPDGTQVKAVTYHGLVVEPRDGGWFARVYVDV